MKTKGMTHTINCQGRLFSFDRPVVMGILNVTPDSFYDGGSYYNNAEAIRKRATQIVSEGADIIDIGAYSTRPGAKNVAESDELRRLSMALDIVRKDHPDAIISVDTFRGEVARRSIKELGANIINDISAYEMDPDMLEAVAEVKAPYVLTHMQGTPATMQEAPHYDGRVTDAVVTMLSKKVNELTSRGVSDIIIDPGFGFGKTVEQNFQMMADLHMFKAFDRPLLVGVSRKSMIFKTIGGTAKTSLNGTSILNTVALLRGADILRVHDVKECVEVVKLVAAIEDGGREQ